MVFVQTIGVRRVAYRKPQLGEIITNNRRVQREETSTCSDRQRALAERLRANQIGLAGSVRSNERVYRSAIDLYIWL
jgi:hypothetical protein